MRKAKRGKFNHSVHGTKSSKCGPPSPQAGSAKANSRAGLKEHVYGRLDAPRTRTNKCRQDDRLIRAMYRGENYT